MPSNEKLRQKLHKENVITACFQRQNRFCHICGYPMLSYKYVPNQEPYYLSAILIHEEIEGTLMPKAAHHKCAITRKIYGKVPDWHLKRMTDLFNRKSKG